jgi:nucleoside-diphosphate-sugar epimerase
VQADASREAHLERIFSAPKDADEEEWDGWDYVINCAGETRPALDEAVYQARNHALSTTLAAEAAKQGVQCYVEMSTAHVYKVSGSSTETSTLKPRQSLATWKLSAEDDLRKIKGLPLVVLRLAHVYGPYAARWLGTALCLARVYQSEEGEMRWLGGKDLRTDTVHVEDVARAIWQVCGWYAAQKKKESVVFNLVDGGQTSKFRISWLTNWNLTRISTRESRRYITSGF